MKSLIEYIKESMFKENENFNKLALEVQENPKQYLKYFKNATFIKISATKSYIVVLLGVKDNKIDVNNGIREMMKNTKNFNSCSKDLVFSVYEFPNDNEIKIFVDLSSAASDNADNRKMAYKNDHPKILIDPTEF